MSLMKTLFNIFLSDNISFAAKILLAIYDIFEKNEF